jgi:hypothetical protein
MGSLPQLWAAVMLNLRPTALSVTIRSLEATGRCSRASWMRTRKAALMSRPGRDGTDPFANFLVAAAIARDLEALPPEVRLRPAVQRAMQAGRGGPHDAACVLRALDGMAEAIGAVSPRPPGG